MPIPFSPIAPRNIKVSYTCPITKKIVDMDLDGISTREYGNSDCGCDSCDYGDSGVTISIYCRSCKREHMVQEY